MGSEAGRGLEANFTRRWYSSIQTYKRKHQIHLEIDQEIDGNAPFRAISGRDSALERLASAVRSLFREISSPGTLYT